MNNNANSEKKLDADTKALLGEEARRPFYKRGAFWLVAALIAISATGGWYVFGNNKEGKVAYQTSQLEKGNLRVDVTANGTLNPIRTVSLGSELSGIVRKVNVDVNDTVKQGQVLIELDDTKLKASVERAKATLELAKAALAESQATLKEAKAKLARLQEVRKLSGGKSPSKTELDAQEALVAKGEAAVDSAKAKITDSEQALTSAQSDLSKTQIISPIDGVVLARSVEPGYAVAASLQAVELLKLATDLRNLELRINVDEADVGAVKAGQKASFTVSAYPDRVFPAELKKVAFGSTQTDNVITYVTYLEVENPNLLLRPGMTATASIRTVSLRDATLVPNTALRFQPSEAEESKKGSSLSMFGPPMRRNSAKKTSGTLQSANAAQKKATLYVLKGGKPEPVEVTIGYSDGRVTQLVDGPLKEGDRVIIDQKRGGK